MSRCALDRPVVASGSTGTSAVSPGQQQPLEPEPVQECADQAGRDWQTSICCNQPGKPKPKPEPVRPIRAGVAWGDVAEKETPRARIDPVWFTFDGVIADDRTRIEVQGTNGAWRTLPTRLSLAEEGANGSFKYVLQTSVEEAVRLGLAPNRACAFRMVTPDGACSEATPPVVINDPKNALSRPDHRPMEDRFSGDNQIRQPQFIAQPTEPRPEDVQRIAQAKVEIVDGKAHLSLPPGSLDPGVVIDTHHPVYAAGHGVRSALAHGGSDETRANPDGSLSMTFDASYPLALRARHVSGGPVAAALFVDGRLLPWGDGPFAYLEDKGRFSWARFAEAVGKDNIHLSNDKGTIEAGAGTLPLASGLAVVNISAKGVVWGAVKGKSLPVEADGSFSVPIKDQTFGGLRVNDQIAVVVWPRVHGINDGLILLFQFDGERLSLKSTGASLEGAAKTVGRVPPRNG